MVGVAHIWVCTRKEQTMAVKQLTAFIENQPGKLKTMVEAISNADVNIRAMSIADTKDFGILRIIVSDTDKAKAALAASLAHKAHLYVWDEPLNYIDVISRIQLERLITEAKPTLLFVEHDRAFCGNTATKEIVIS